MSSSINPRNGCGLRTSHRSIRPCEVLTNPVELAVWRDPLEEREGRQSDTVKCQDDGNFAGLRTANQALRRQETRAWRKRSTTLPLKSCRAGMRSARKRVARRSERRMPPWEGTTGFHTISISPSIHCFASQSKVRTTDPISRTKIDHGSTAPNASGPNISNPKVP